MPFTFSHPAAVLPFKLLPKRFISMTGLVIGSLSPDFEYFFRMKTYSSFSHTWSGLFWFDLPLTIILAFVFHLVVRDSLIDHLPRFLNTRLFIFKNFNWTKQFKENFLVVAIATHIVWDGFTHEQGQFVQSIPSLKYSISIAGFNTSIYKLLQHASTIIGGAIIIYALLQLPRNNSFINQQSIFPFWVSVASFSLLVVRIRLLTGLDFHIYGYVIASAISGGLIGLVVSAIIFPLPSNSAR